MTKNEYRERFIRKLVELGLPEIMAKEHLERAWDYAMWSDPYLRDPEGEAVYYFEQEL